LHAGRSRLPQGWQAILARAVIRLSCLSLAATLGAGCAGDRGPSTPTVVRPRLVCETMALIAGQTAYLGIDLDLARGWHLYWTGRSDSGAPPSIQMEMPTGYRPGELLWPAPRRQLSPGRILDHVYRDRLLLILPVAVPDSAAVGDTVTFGCRLDWVVCKDVCLVDSARVSLKLPVSAATATARSSPEAPLFVSSRQRLPRPLSEGKDQGVRTEWQQSNLAVHVPEASYLAFYPAVDCGALLDLIDDGESTNGTLLLRFTPSPGGPGPAKGVLEIRTKAQDRPVFYSLNLDHPGRRVTD
jgi:DsbC/DsbD-like thiol-disulfide interchange protein